jgi:hypothetical protein
MFAKLQHGKRFSDVKSFAQKQTFALTFVILSAINLIPILGHSYQGCNVT